MDRAAAHRLLTVAAALQADARGLRLTVDLATTRAIDFSSVVTDTGLRLATGRLYADGHYARAVEEGMKYVSEQVRRRTGLQINGTALMETAFGPKAPLLQLNDLKTQSDEDEQRGFMLIFSGSVAAIRNPRAHRHGHEDSPEVALELLGWANHLSRLIGSARLKRRRNTRSPRMKSTSMAKTPRATS
jgi:uncharacterized protein (TIGR02391 family)